MLKNKGTFLLALLLLPVTVFAMTDVDPYEARYAVTWHGMEVGESVHRLAPLEDGRWRLVSETEPYLGFLPYEYSESAIFEMDGKRVIPLTYEYDAQEGLKNKKGVLVFDYAQAIVKNSNADRPWQTPIQPNMFDKLTQTIAMRQDLIDGKDNLTYNVVENQKLRTYAFTMVGEETLETAIGSITVLKLEHEYKRRKRKTIFWVSPEHDFLLVKMSQYRKGKLVAGGEILKYSLIDPFTAEGQLLSDG